MKKALLIALALLLLAPLAVAQEILQIQDLVDRLGHESFEEREKAHTALVRIGEPAVSWLKKAADSSDPEVKSRVGQILETIPFYKILGMEGGRAFVAASGIDRFDLLIKYGKGDLEEGQGLFIADAVLEGFAWREHYDGSLHQLELSEVRWKVKDGPMLLSWVLVRMTQHAHGYVRLLGVLGLGEMDAKERASFVARILDDSNDHVRRGSASALGQFGAREYTAEVEDLLNDPKPRVRWSAIQALAQLTGSWEVCAKALNDTDGRNRARTADLLDQMDAKEGLASLRATLEKEPKQDVRRRMRSAIRSLESLRGSRRPVEGRMVLTSHDSGIVEASYIRVRAAAEWKSLWARHSAGEAPDLDFADSMVIAVFSGTRINSGGLKLVSLDEDDETVRLRFDQRSYQTIDGGGNQVTPFGLFAIPRSEKSVRVEEDLKSLIECPFVWREQALKSLIGWPSVWREQALLP